MFRFRRGRSIVNRQRNLVLAIGGLFVAFGGIFEDWDQAFTKDPSPCASDDVCRCERGIAFSY